MVRPAALVAAFFCKKNPVVEGLALAFLLLLGVLNLVGFEPLEFALLFLDGAALSDGNGTALGTLGTGEDGEALAALLR